MPNRKESLKELQERHDNGTLIQDFENVDLFNFDQVYFYPIVNTSGEDFDVDVGECILVSVRSEDDILRARFAAKGTFSQIEPHDVFEFEEDCWQHIVDKLTQAQDCISSNISIAKCRVRECKDAALVETEDTE